MTDEARTLRRRYDDLVARIDQRLPLNNTGSSSLLVKTATKTSYPTSAPSFYYCQVQTVTGAEVEGGTGTLSADSGSFVYALNLGSAIPPVGTPLIVTFEPYRWTFRYDG